MRRQAVQTVQATRLAVLASVALLGLSACASSNDYSQTVTTAFASVQSAGRDAKPRTRRIPRPSSDEYLRSWGVHAVGAEAAYQSGATGKGVTIALIDTGVPRGANDLRVSRASVDLIRRKSKPGRAPADHARSVAAPLASVLNGKGVMGLAYDATLLSIRADLEGACAIQCAMRTNDVARGIDYAIAKKARIIILALVSPDPDHRLSEPFQAALQRAVDAGAIVVIAGGNGARTHPAWPARFAEEPRYKGQVIAVGATGADGQLTRWSNRAGAAKNAYLAAPGAGVLTGCDGEYCTLVSGTSFSTPYVAGAAALLMDAYPHLTGQQVAALLLGHAKDLGEPGPDAVYGRGLLDVGAAFQAAAAAS